MLKPLAGAALVVSFRFRLHCQVCGFPWHLFTVCFEARPCMHCSCFRELPLDSLGCIFIYAGDSATGNLIAAAKLGPCKTATAARDTEVEGVYNYSDFSLLHWLHWRHWILPPSRCFSQFLGGETTID